MAANVRKHPCQGRSVQFVAGSYKVNDVAFVTIIAKNYTAYAKTLLRSLKLTHDAASLYTVVVDAVDRGTIRELAELTNSRVLSPLDFLPYEFAMGLAYSYDVTELSTALKPFVLRHLLNLGHGRAIYLDPDIRVFRSLEADVLSPLQSGSIVVTPHTMDPIPIDGHIPTEITLLLAGAYNLGFIGVRDCRETREFLSWWADRLERFCVNDVARGLFVDQKWIDLVPSLFPGTRILRHRGLNVAYWNLHSRRIIMSESVPMLLSGEPLIFFHFSGFDPQTPTRLSRHQDRIEVKASPALETILQDYARELIASGHENFSKASYGYGTLSDGTPVDHIVRLLCREARDRGLMFPDPYDVDGEPSLLDYCNGNEAAQPAGLPRLTRYIARLHASRADLQVAFPQMHGDDRSAYLQWVRTDPHHKIARSFIEATLCSPVEHLRGGAIVNVAGYFASESGVGEAGRAHAAAVRAAGCAVHLVDFTDGAVFSRRRETAVEAASREGPINLVCVNADQLPVFAKIAGDKFFCNRYTIGSWYWELPTFPQAWNDRFDLLDEIWVGSEYVRRAISAATPIPVLRIPPIVAPLPVRDNSKERFGFPSDAFVFLFLFDFLSIFERKNPLGTVEAFRRAFAGRSDVRLVIKTINAGHDPDNASLLRRTCAGDPRIDIRETYLTRDEKNAMIAAADCYVSLHRAEGFGLTIAEAMYYGTPVICTDWSGNADFTSPANAYVIKSKLIMLDRDFGPYAAGQYWADPDLEAAAIAMRRVFADPWDGQARAVQASADIRKHYSAEAVGTVIAGRVEHALRELAAAG